MELIQKTYYDQSSDDTLVVTRFFNFPVNIVANAWSDPAILNQWFTPENNFISKVDNVFFSSNYPWYFNVNHSDNIHFSNIADMFSVIAYMQFKMENPFCESDGRMRQDHPTFNYSISYESTISGTIVSCLLTFNNADELNTFTEQNFKEEFASSHVRLDTYLAEH
jgi:hypothetical protein